MLRKWYFGANLNGLAHAFDQVQAAVRSARRMTSLSPIMLLDDEGDRAAFSDRVDWLRDQGVAVISHRASLFPLVRSRYDERADVFSGHWLRCDIPLLEMEDEFVLYTDIDVVFRSDVAGSAIAPPYVACAPEHRANDLSYFNSGVMVMNLPGLRRTRDAFVSTLRDRLDDMAAHDDQGVFNVCYRDTWERLPNSWNWKPYWGWNEEADIIHFHGPKPEQVRTMLAGDLGLFGAELAEIVQRDVDAYGRYLRLFDNLTASPPGSDEA